MSGPEIILWAKLRPLRPLGYAFRRQAPIGGYFIDFACLSRRLAIEVDGSQHGEEIRSEHDFVRDRILERHGFTVLRFRASDVRHNIDWVMERIFEALEDPRKSSPIGARGARVTLPYPGCCAACPSPQGEGKTRTPHGASGESVP